MKWKVITYAVLFIFALWIRIYQVGTIPPSLSWDEVSIGYNAFSLLKTGRDEHGKFLPLDTFEAYGDYKPPVSIYLTVLPVLVFGLTEFAVRLPSVFFGTLTVGLLYFLVHELFSTKGKRTDTIALLAMAGLALSPWHIQLSRGGFEGNIAVFFVSLGVYLVLCSRRNPGLFAIAWIPFVLSVYTFNSARYFTPFLGLALIIFVGKSIRTHWKQFFIGVFVALILMIPITPHLLSPQAKLRFQEVNIFTDPEIVLTANSRIARDGNTWWAKVLHNRRVGYVRSYLLHYMDNLQPQFLFTRGDGNPKFSIQEVGQLYLYEAPFLVIGILAMLSVEPKVGLFLLYWLLAAIIPAAVARETPHALRIENSLPTWNIFIAFGILTTVTLVGKRMRRAVVGGIGLLCALGFLFFVHYYFQHAPKDYSAEWQYGYREAIDAIAPLSSSYDSIVMSEIIGRPYMYVAFYTQIAPHVLWSTVTATTDVFGFYSVSRLGKYQFVKGSVGAVEPNTLYVLAPEDVPTGVRILKTIHVLNGKPVLVLFDKS